MLDLNQRLENSGGGLNPAVNIQMVNYYSRNVSRGFETAKALPGWQGYVSTTIARDMLFNLFNIHRNGWSLLIHPGVVPFHMDDFIPAYARQTGMERLALTDLGDVLIESFHRRNPINRESSRLVIVEQFRRLQENTPNMVVFGGNDYSLYFASHVVDMPTEADMHAIIDYEVPFMPMVLHGFMEYAGRPANVRENYTPAIVLLNSMSTGASPRYTFTEQPTHNMRFTPYEYLYSTHYANWINTAIEHYQIFNDTYRHLRGERIVDFQVLAGGYMDVDAFNQVTVTVFSDGTRIYVNNTSRPFELEGVYIEPRWFNVVRGGQS
jgi:hypothetical protein